MEERKNTLSKGVLPPGPPGSMLSSSSLLSSSFFLSSSFLLLFFDFLSIFFFSSSSFFLIIFFRHRANRFQNLSMSQADALADATLLCIVPTLADDPRRESRRLEPKYACRRDVQGKTLPGFREPARLVSEHQTEDTADGGGSGAGTCGNASIAFNHPSGCLWHPCRRSLQWEVEASIRPLWAPCGAVDTNRGHEQAVGDTCRFFHPLSCHVLTYLIAGIPALFHCPSFKT